jgi:hypothetical protein
MITGLQCYALVPLQKIGYLPHAGILLRQLVELKHILLFNAGCHASNNNIFLGNGWRDCGCESDGGWNCYLH